MMLPIERVEIRYPDRSTYVVPDDGTWAQAPPFGVDAIVYYHVDRPERLDVEYTTEDSGSDIYWWQGEGDLAEHKMGLWHDGVHWFREMNYAEKTVLP